MWISRNEAKELNDQLYSLRKERDDALSSIYELRQEKYDLGVAIQRKDEIIARRDAKIKDQMEGLQALNRDLDAWEPLANLIASMVRPFKEQEITVPQAGINMLESYRKLRDGEDQPDKGG